jgi:polynucleotide 5'-kinase involved in rRNA processing
VEALPLHADEDAQLELKLGEDSCAEIFEGNTVEPAWVWAAEKMERDDVVAVLGRPDSGKTSYTTIAANIAVSKYGRCSVVSLDPGQTYFTPPTVVGPPRWRSRFTTWLSLNPSGRCLLEQHLHPTGRL